MVVIPRFARTLFQQILFARAKVSVPVNGILVPIKTAVELIRRFCTPAFFYHEGQPVFDMSKAGSAFLVRYRGRNLALCTRHQLGRGLGATRPEQFTVTLFEPGGTKVGLSPNVVSHVHMEHAEHSNLEDLLLLEYENTRGTRNLRGMFLELDMAQTLETVDPASIKAIFAVGYPTAFGDVDVKCDEEGNITGMDMELRWVKLYLAADKSAPFDTENRRAMIQDPKADQETVDPDGMSGAPVLFVWLDPSSQAHLGFAGMITHARDRRYMIYDGAVLRRVVDRYVDESGP